MTSGRRVAVVGGGIAGLATAYHLLHAEHEHGHQHGRVEVVLYERDGRLGGKIDGGPFAGLDHVDAGPDAFLARVPGATQLAAAVGLGDALAHPERVGAAVWHDRLHPIPEGLVLGVPARLGSLARTRLLTWRGKLRAGLDLILPHTSLEPDSIGRFVRARLGDEVHERLVDALVGSIYAADTDRFSLAEVPQLAGLAGRGRSLILTGRAMASGSGTAAAAGDQPVFAAPAAGMTALCAATADRVRAAGGTIATGVVVSGLSPVADGGRWHLSGTDAAGEPVDDEVDAVVLACPAHAASDLLGATTPAAADLLRRAETADVVMVTLHVAGERWPDRLRGMSGYLVPKPVQRDVTAVSFGSQKWGHWRPPAGGEILRVSLGRDGVSPLGLDDDTILERTLADLRRHLDVDVDPLATRISRWPGAFAQYRPHHGAWADAVDAALPPGVFVTGAAYRGIGIPACVRGAATIAGRTAQHLAGLRQSSS